MRSPGNPAGFIVLALLLIAPDLAIGAEPWGPWSVNSDAPVILTKADRERPARPSAEKHETSMAATPFSWMLKIYQNFVSPLDGDRCPMHPTCSQYSVQAIRKHGPVIGIVMTTDRLLHEADEQRLARQKNFGDRLRYLDPLDNNDFWWTRK
ncbi:MAG: membrane protein insertion efficiency factor YidD [Nitrospirota bacterium]|nr:membrane protein insertion efficiency factor YidD [Nitrospirota bacterium]